jgi:hypothetical protein
MADGQDQRDVAQALASLEAIAKRRGASFRQAEYDELAEASDLLREWLAHRPERSSSAPRGGRLA